MGRVTSVIVDDLPLVTGLALASELLFLGILILSMRSSSLRPDVESRPATHTPAALKRAALGVGVVALVVAGAFHFQRQIGLRIFTAAANRMSGGNRLDGLLDGLHVGLAGTGSPLPDQRRHGACSFVLAGKHLFIVDSGPGVSSPVK